MSVYRFNGLDPEISFGLTIERGVDSQLLTIPELKDNGLSIDWAEENGTERYHGIRRFKSKTYSITGVIIASSPSELMQKYTALSQFFITTGEFNLDDIKKARRWKVFYSKTTAQVKLNSRSLRLTFELIDDYPTEIFSV
ncbi:hypothetical protein [Sphingobacterium hotanense]|uniref:Phage tail protein n=1 Tax=Sphingobacterium hotanense TaxID=649196 RepID=A0ABT7NQ54_9SPHI|nr:hypothetical protein [Sphingobacterium hotanense]MDM1049382.1 hypothetical protein [Sphingobacterium hotanense]